MVLTLSLDDSQVAETQDREFLVTPEDVDNSGRLEPARDLLDRFVSEECVAGVALTIAIGGQPVAAFHRGRAAADQWAVTSTLWPMASITKLYTAATVMALVESGELTLSMPVRNILPGFVGEGRERVTLRHLLTHTSGLIYEPPDMEGLLVAQRPLQEIVDAAVAQQLLFDPGTDWRYSDLGYALLGRVAATATGVSFPELVRRLVLVPAGLSDTFLPPPRSADSRLAHVDGALAAGTAGAMYNAPYAHDLAHPAFGVVATANDLLRFGLLFAPNRGYHLLSEATVRTMTTDQVGAASLVEPESPLPGAMRSWGAGFMLKGPAGFPALASPGSFGHGGGTGCLLWIDPANDVVVAFVSNRHVGADPGKEVHAQRLERIVNVVLACLSRAGLQSSTFARTRQEGETPLPRTPQPVGK